MPTIKEIFEMMPDEMLNIEVKALGTIFVRDDGMIASSRCGFTTEGFMEAIKELHADWLKSEKPIYDGLKYGLAKQ